MNTCCDDENLEWQSKEELYKCLSCHCINEEESRDEITRRVVEETGYLGNYAVKRYKGYMVRHHISEVFKRIECTEPNKPTDLEAIKSSLKGDYSLSNIWKRCNRKHMIYIYCTLNGLSTPMLFGEIRDHITQSIIHMSHDHKKLPNYIYIIKCICDKYGYEDLKQYLYVKVRKKKLDDFIHKYI